PAGAGASPEHRVDPPPDGRDVVVLEGPPQGLREVVEAGPPVHDEAATVATDSGRSFHVVLVADLSDDLLEDVLQGDQPRGAAELVDDDREVGRPALELAELAVESLRLRHEERRAHQVLPPGRAAVSALTQPPHE